MARLYSNENFALQVVELLRGRGHDVLTSQEAGNINQRIADDVVLDFATGLERILVTYNRRDFFRLHKTGRGHAGIILCKENRPFHQQAVLIDRVLSKQTVFERTILKAYGPGMT